MPFDSRKEEVGSAQSCPAATPKSAATQPAVLLDTTRREDAILCGADRADEPEEAFRVEFDPHFPIVTLNGPDGEIVVVGRSAIRQYAQAFNDALALAERAERRAA